MQHSRLCVQPVSREDNGATFLCQHKDNAALNGSVQLEVTCECPRAGDWPRWPSIICQEAQDQCVKKVKEGGNYKAFLVMRSNVCWMTT